MLSRQFPYFIIAAFFLTALTSAAASAEVIRADGAYGCRSREEYEVFGKFISERNLYNYNNALKNGECIRIPFGLDVHVIKRKGGFFFSVVRLPGDEREWWTSSNNFLTAIEMEKWLANLDALAKEFQEDSKVGEGAQSPHSPSNQQIEKPWYGVPTQLPLALRGNIATPAGIFRDTKGSVWAVMALKRTANAGEAEVSAQGSAVAVSPSHLVTNCHVVAGAERLILSQGAEQFDAILLSEDSISDRCILTAQKPLANYVHGVRSFSDLEIGERVFTVGSPRGLEQTLGDGLISGLRSDASTRYIQTSAPISPGSSGGGLFDSSGNLLGITTFMLKDSQSLNFAIAAEDFWRAN
jgi:hypothetical protein